jgi:NAD(P)-dependent dehydrogenase (short-subunit alcohol dehydrogenase family)
MTHTVPAGWTADDIPDLTGKVAVVTGSSSGLGLVAARELAAHGADVTLAVRDEAKGERAAAEIRAAHPAAQVSVAHLDLTDLANIATFTKTFTKSHKRLDILVNNAGIMGLPTRELTKDGFEAQFGTNHLGHFALTGNLMPLIKKTKGARIVTVSSNLHKNRRMNFDDLNAAKSYKGWGAYGQSKLANLLFTSELQRRLEAETVDAIAVAAHPGWSNTPLMVSGPMKGRGAFMKWLGQSVNNRMAQPVEMGALNEIYAAVAPGVEGNDYFGPDGKRNQSGYPSHNDRSDAAKNQADAERLWTISESLTGVKYF